MKLTLLEQGQKAFSADQLNNAADAYFNLLVKDWAERNGLSEKEQARLKAFLVDFYYFAEGELEEQSIPEQMQETFQEKAQEISELSW